MKTALITCLVALWICIGLNISVSHSRAADQIQEPAKVPDIGTLTLRASDATTAIITATATEPKSIVYSSGFVVTGFKLSAPDTVMRMSGVFNLYQTQIEKAEKPEDVAVTLTTKDGKRWRATWQEERP